MWIFRVYGVYDVYGVTNGSKSQGTITFIIILDSRVRLSAQNALNSVIK